MRSIFRALLPVLAIAPALAACAVSTSPVTGRQRAYAYSWQQEIEIGRRADREIVDQFGTYDDPELEAYVRGVGEAVLAASHLRRPEALPEYQATRFTFRVLDTEIVNAFALPGGYVYVTRGLLAHLDNEAQLAVVLGHEIGHVAARHTAQDALQSGFLVAALLGADFLAEGAGVRGEIVDAASIGAQLLLFRYSRDDERESDRLGVEYAALAGYRAAEGAEFFTALERMQARDSWFPAFLSTHPDPGRREQTVAQLAAEWAAKGHAGERVDRDGYLARLEGMTLGEDPRQGFEEDGVFYHPAGEFRFPLPRGWSMGRDGRRMQFVPADQDEPALEVQFGSVSRSETALGAAADFVGANGLENVSTSRTELNGFPGARVEATMDGDEGEESYRVFGYWIEQAGQVRRFVGISTAEEAGAMQDAVETMTRGFRVLTDPDILSMQPARLALVAVDVDTPFRDLMEGSDPPYGMDLEGLAIMNGIEPDGVVPAGSIVKLPR